MLTRGEIEAALSRWLRAWDELDLDAVMELFHAEAVFETWTGLRIAGRDRIRDAWRGWFAAAGGFRFEREALLIDEAAQAAVFAWRYVGPPLGGGAGSGEERRRGVDLVRFADGAIIEKISYSKTVLERGGARVALRP